MAPRSAPATSRAYLARTPVAYARDRRFPLLSAALELGRLDEHVQAALVRVDGDAVAVLDQGDRAAVRRLGGHVADAEAVGAAGEAAVGDERTVAPAPGAGHGAGDGQHLAHAGAALGALVADDDHGARRRSAPARMASMAALLAVEDPRAGPSKVELAVDPGHLDDRALRRERPA